MFDRKLRIYFMLDIDFFLNCLFVDVCNFVWYCFENFFIMVIGIIVLFFVVVGFFVNFLLFYKICRRGVKLLLIMIMIGVLFGSNCIFIVVNYFFFLVYFGYFVDSEYILLKFKILVILMVLCIIIFGFYVV